jgi:hypothetical protein
MGVFAVISQESQGFQGEDSFFISCEIDNTKIMQVLHFSELLQFPQQFVDFRVDLIFDDIYVLVLVVGIFF